MTKGGQLKTVTVAVLVALLWMTGKAGAAQCGSTAAGFEAWKRQFADEAKERGVSASTVGGRCKSQLRSTRPNVVERGDYRQ